MKMFKLSEWKPHYMTVFNFLAGVVANKSGRRTAAARIYLHFRSFPCQVCAKSRFLS